MLVWCAPSMETHSSHSQRTQGLETLVPCVTSWAKIPFVWRHQHQQVDSWLLQYYACYKKGKLHVNIQHADGTEWVLVKFCPKAGVNLFSLMCELLQGKTISSNHQNNIMVNSMDGSIILDHQIMTHDGWVAGDEFLQQTNEKRAQLATAPLQEKYQIPTCWTQSSIWVNYSCHC